MYIEIIDYKEFAKVALDKNDEIFIIHVASRSLKIKITIYQAQEDKIFL